MLILFGYVGVEKKELIIPVSAVVFVLFISTLGMVSAMFSLCWQSMNWDF